MEVRKMRWFLSFCMVLLPGAALAQGWIELLPRPTPQAARVERLRTSVTVRVTDRIARVQIEESFRNNGTGLAEGDYIYPLAGEAVFSDFALMQGEEELKGEAMDADRARAIYEEIVRRHRDPALIELAGHGLLRARIFPIPAGETRNVTLRFTQVLGQAGDAYRFRYVAGTARPRAPIPRIRPATQIEVPEPPAPQDGAPISFTLIVEGADRFGEPYSPTHRVRASRDGQRLVVRPDGQLNGSVDVFLPLARPAVGISLATHRVGNEDGYFMLTLSPGRGQATPTPRDLVVVVDTSGSMSGEKIEQARQALHRLLGTLNQTDRFRLIAFGNRVDAQRPEWTTASRTAVEEARTWVNALAATGGTNISGALDEAFRIPAGEGRLHQTIFITDGMPTAGETDPDRIAARVEANRGNARIFTFGVGYDLQTYLLERIAVAGRGSVDYVEPGADVEEAVGSLAAKISHPVLVDLAFAGSPVRLKDFQPTRLPDLFAGDEMVVFGRYEIGAANAGGDLSITGARNGRREQFAARVDFPARTTSGDYIPGLWAARKIGELMRTIRIEGETPARVAEVRELALRYGLLTEYTSYLVLEPGMTANFGGGLTLPAAAAAPPAVAITGASAVSSARLAAERRATQTAADLSRLESAVSERMTQGRSIGERTIAGRQFHQESGAWIDRRHTATARVIHVEPFSRAYFDLLTSLPELKPYATAFDTVTIAGTGVSIRVAPGGRASLTAAERDAIVSDFRGVKKTR
jgi:Ca-activated chloride channel family protein